MSQQFIVTGTDTDIGKSVFAAALTLALDGYYWKPVQSGVHDGTDTLRVQEMTELPEERFLPERYVLSEPLSPHRAAELDGVELDPAELIIPETDKPLVIEGAGGLMVPLTRSTLLIDHIAQWNIPTILCARTGLGTINHTLLSIEAMTARGIKLHGIAFIGDENDDNMRTIADFSGAKVLGRLPILPSLNAQSLRHAFRENFRINDFKTTDGHG